MTNTAPQRRRRRFGAVRVHEITASGGTFRWNRTTERVQLGWVALVAAGSLELRESEQSVVLSREEGIVLSDAIPVDVSVDAPTTVLKIGLPLALISEVRAPMVHLTVLGRDTSLITPVLGFLTSAIALDEDEISPFSAYYLERLLQEMLLGMLTAVGGNHSAQERGSVYASAIGVITAQCADPGLVVADIAATVNQSSRQLERHFRAKGTTVGAEIRRARMNLASGLLVEASARGLSIDEVARLSGFSSGSTLARAFSKSGMRSPSAIRRSGRAFD
jgi:AraC-like DNA-binding protein